MDTNREKLNTPTVSILMLTYNRAGYMTEAIKSVLNQSYQDWHLFIIDDGSTDNTTEIVDQFPDPRITYIENPENLGIYARRNESLRLVVGKYTAVLDSDDIWHDSSKLEKQVTFMEAHPECVVVGTDIKIIDDNGSVTDTYTYKYSDEDIRNDILLRNQFCHSSVLMRNSSLKKTTGYYNGLAEDLELFLQLGKFGTFANLNEPLTSHREHSGSANDHGIKMSSAVHYIIKQHKDYPHYFLSLIKSHLRLLVARFKNIF